MESKSEAAKSKLHPKLQKLVESGSTDTIYVFATVKGDAAPAEALLEHANFAGNEKGGLLLGQIGTQNLTKLATTKGVVAVGPIELKQTGEPLGIGDPELGKGGGPPGKKTFPGKEVPYSQAPPPKGSNFNDLKTVNALDAKTHRFRDAWVAGFDGDGTTVGVLDGGTDFGHPDLLGTWKTWSGLSGSRAGWNGWPQAFDPYGTLLWLAAPSFIDQGLSWYTKTQAVTCTDFADKGPKANCTVRFATRTGPARNFSAPSGTQEHNYRFPASYTKSGNVRMGSHPDDHLLLNYGERPAFLVTDPNTAGTYDTVYVDLDNDFDFSDEKPVTKGSPASYRDMNGDGYTDLSGGLLAFISDGATRLPGGVDAFNLTLVRPAGETLMWTGDFDPAIGGHGTLTASNVVGQGVAKGLAPTFSDFNSANYPGVLGGAPKAKLAPFGDIYFSFDFSTQLGYFLSGRSSALGNPVDVTSNSYGSSDVDNDGWDSASQEADIIHLFWGGRTTPLFSTGNGAPGFGTTAPPSPSAGISVGASTQFGATGWDSIDRISQVVDNDVMVWSNRGFGATGSPGVDVVADGAFSAGDLTLNTVGDGRFAWETWGGTSRSAPVAAAATAIVYQAYRSTHPGTVPLDFNLKAKEFLKSSAKDLGYDGIIQGAGSVDAADAAAAAAGTRASVSPGEWRVGDYRGAEYEVFSHVIAPGGSDSQEFTIQGGGTWNVSDRQMVRTDTETFDWTSQSVGTEGPYNFNGPDYLMNVTNKVNAHPDADLMVVRLIYPYAEFDSNGDFRSEQDWRLLTYSWTDINADGNLWTDANGNGVVDKVIKGTSSNIDHFNDIDFAHSEIDKGEYVRFMYHRAGSNSLMSFVRDPYARKSDGIFLGLQHPTRKASIPVTHLKVQIDWYENSDWSWVETPSTATGSFSADVEVPEGTPFGMYSGAIVLEKNGDTMIVPVSVAVAAEAAQDGEGQLTEALQFGGADVAEAQQDLLYNNGSVFGAGDWTWRAESGDWRFFFYDVPDEVPAGTLFLARTTWDDEAPYTDLDTLIFGRGTTHCQVLCDDGDTFGAPYVLDTIGGSPNTHLGSGRWRFDTATGGAEDFVAGVAQEGLHAIVLHQVGWQGDQFDTPFEVTVGAASVAPSAVVEETSSDTGSFDVTFSSSLDLDGLAAEAFGLSQPLVTTETAHQDDPNDPSSASIKKDITLNHASRMTVTTGNTSAEDIDLFVVYDANDDGVFTNSEIVGSSTTGSADEHVSLVAPADGDYQVWAQGWNVSGTPTVDVTIDAIQGNDLTVTGATEDPVPAGTPVTLHVEFDKAMTVGEDYFGELLLGPPTAPAALKVPITISRTE